MLILNIATIFNFDGVNKYSIEKVSQNVGALRMHLLSEVFEQFMDGEHEMHHAPGVFNGIRSKTYIEATFIRF